MNNENNTIDYLLKLKIIHLYLFKNAYKITK